MNCCPLLTIVMKKYVNNPIEANHSRLKSRLRMAPAFTKLALAI